MEPNEAIAKQLEETLAGNGINTEKLVVLYAGMDCYMGEVVRTEGNEFVLRNPKRIVRTQQMRGDQFNVSFIAIDGDLLVGKEARLHVHPHAYFRLDEQDFDTKSRYLTLYMQWIEQARRASAAAAGIVAPDEARPLPPPRLVGPQNGQLPR